MFNNFGTTHRLKETHWGSVVSVLTGAYYNIIKVPPTKVAEEETLEGTTVLCSIPAEDKTKPSYYHSFGESKICKL